MSEDLAAFKETPAPPIGAVHARLSRRRTWRRVRGVAATGVALGAAAVLFVWTPDRPSQRDRGMSAAVARVVLTAVADGPQGARPVADGGSVAADERVVFFVTAEAPGVVGLQELGPTGPADVAAFASWSVRAGEQPLGGNTPLSWRPDRGPGVYSYVVTVCPEGVTIPGLSCVQDVIALKFDPSAAP